MRLASAPEWRNLHDQGKTIKVFLDGKEVPLCEMADEESGVVVCYVPDADGLIQVHPEDNDKIWTQTLRGDVRIVVE